MTNPVMREREIAIEDWVGSHGSEFSLTVTVEWQELASAAVIKQIKKHLRDHEGFSQAQVDGLDAKIAAFAARVSPNLKRVSNVRYEPKMKGRTPLVVLPTGPDYWMGIRKK